MSRWRTSSWCERWSRVLPDQARGACIEQVLRKATAEPFGISEGSGSGQSNRSGAVSRSDHGPQVDLVTVVSDGYVGKRADGSSAAGLEPGKQGALGSGRSACCRVVQSGEDGANSVVAAAAL